MQTDRRSAVKVRHRQAILDAAVSLVADGEGTRFSAEDLAERAGVSRRTIFNHFATLDDVLLTLCTDTLRVETDKLWSALGSSPVPDPSRAAMFTAVARALRGTELSEPIVQIWRALSGIGIDSDQTQAFTQQALSQLANELADTLAAHRPGADPLDVHLLASLLTHGLGVIARHWIESTPPGRAPSRAAWEALLDRLLATLGDGYLTRS